MAGSFPVCVVLGETQQNETQTKVKKERKKKNYYFSCALQKFLKYPWPGK